VSSDVIESLFVCQQIVFEKAFDKVNLPDLPYLFDDCVAAV
jgi:hypothetical protein